MHIFAICCLAFIIGCFCGIKVPVQDICMGLVLFCSAFVIKLIISKVKSLGNLYVTGILVAFLIGILSGGLHNYNTFLKVTPLYNTNVTTQGIVTESSGGRLIVNNGDYSVYVYVDKEMYVPENTVVKVSGKLKAFDKSQFTGDTDFRYYYALKGIVGRMYDVEVTKLGYDDNFSVWKIGAKVRSYVESKVNEYSLDYRVRGLMTALLTGNTDELDNRIKQNFRLTGISHLVAVSGLHMGIFLSFFLFITLKIRKNRILHFVFILLLVVLYIIFIGERASVLRAGIMTIISYFVFGINRRNGGIMKLMLAGVIICIINPFYAVDVGFQLSFTVTLGLLLYTEFFRHKVIAVPFIAMIFIMPFSVYYFNTISLETVVVNLLTVPIIPAVVLFGYIGCVIPFFGFMAGVLSLIVISVAEFFAKFDWLHITVPSPGVWNFVVFYLLCCAVYFLLDNRKISKMILMLILASVISVNMYVYRGINGVPSSIKSVDDMIFIVTDNGYNVVVNPGYKLKDYVVKKGIDEIIAVMTDDYKSKYEYLEDASSNCKINMVLVPESAQSKNLQLEKYRVLYYNQDGYNFNVDGVGIGFEKDFININFYNNPVKILLPVKDNGDIKTYGVNIFGIIPVY